MSNEPDPPRKFYQLKPKEFDRVNAPVGTTPADASATDVYGHLKAANAAPTSPHPPPPSAGNDVHTILRDNLSHANAAGLNELASKPKRRSRRAHDYWLLLLAFNAVFAFVAFGPYANLVMFVGGLAGIAFFSIGLTWVMWFVMEDY